MARAGVTGGTKMEAALKKIAEKLTRAKGVKVGFLEGAEYSDGTPVASVAIANEFGATINVEAHTQTIFRQVNKAGTAFNKNGRFVKESQSNFASDHDVGAHTITIPPRPFFRTTVKEGAKHWGKDLGKALIEKKYDAKAALNLVGENIKGELQKSIKDWQSPPNAASTVAKKGFNDPLIDDGTMLNAVDKEVED